MNLLKNLTTLTLLLSHSALLAQVCKPISKEMGQFENQKLWQAHKIESPDVPGGIEGFVDKENNFYLGDLTRRGQFAAQVVVDKNNESFEDFFKYCNNAEDKGSYLRSMRRSEENNKYSINLKYLPKVSGFKNDPFLDQSFKEHNVEIGLTFNQDSLVSTLEYEPQILKTEIFKNLQKQVLAQKEFGVIKLDLTNMDDFVCDLIQGKAKLTVRRAALSQGPQVEQKIEVNPSDVKAIYETLKEKISQTASRDQFMFLAGRTMNKMEADRKISAYSDNKSFEILSKMTSTPNSNLTNMGLEDLQCVSDQLQNYSHSLIQHYLDVQFKFSPLGLIQSENGGGK